HSGSYSLTNNGGFSDSCIRNSPFPVFFLKAGETLINIPYFSNIFSDCKNAGVRGKQAVEIRINKGPAIYHLTIFGIHRFHPAHPHGRIRGFGVEVTAE